MFAPRTLRTFGELAALFAEMRVPHRADAEQQTVEAGALRLRWDKHAPFLHVIQPILTDVPPDRTPAVEREVARINHEAQLPVLDFDASTATIAFRVTAIVLVDGVRLDWLQSVLAGIDVRVRELRIQLSGLLARA